MKKILLFTLLISFCGFSQNDDFKNALKKSDTIKAFRKRSIVIRKIIDKKIISELKTKKDTLSHFHPKVFQILTFLFLKPYKQVCFCVFSRK